MWNLGTTNVVGVRHNYQRIEESTYSKQNLGKIISRFVGGYCSKFGGWYE